MKDSPNPAALAAIKSRIDDIADQAGVDGAARLGIDETLAALPWAYRRHLVLALQSLTAFSPDPGVRAAAEDFTARAAQVWATMPFQGHQPDSAGGIDMSVEIGRSNAGAAGEPGHRKSRPAVR